MILGGAERQDRAAIGKREEACLLAGHELFQYHFRARCAKRAGEHVLDRLDGLALRFGDNDALARCQTICLDDDRQPEIRERRDRAVLAVDAFIGGSRNPGPLAEILGKAFRSFQLRRLLTRSEYRISLHPQIVGEAIDQRRFRPDHHQADRMTQAEIHHGAMIRDIQIDQCRMLGYAGVAWRGIKGRKAGRLRQLPGQSMFAAAAAQQKDVHFAHVPGI